MDTNQQNTNFDEMVAGAVAISTRANGKQTLNTEQATLLVQAHICASTPCQCEQNTTNRQQEKNPDSFVNQSSSSLYALQVHQGRVDHSQPIHQQVQSKPTLKLLYETSADRPCTDSSS